MQIYGVTSDFNIIIFTYVVKVNTLSNIIINKTFFVYNFLINNEHGLKSL